jgi:hypothetical protein
MSLNFFEILFIFILANTDFIYSKSLRRNCYIYNKQNGTLSVLSNNPVANIVYIIFFYCNYIIFQNMNDNFA